MQTRKTGYDPQKGCLEGASSGESGGESAAQSFQNHDRAGRNVRGLPLTTALAESLGTS